MVRIHVNSIFTIRSGTEEQWNSVESPGKGSFRILETGEIGWVIGTDKFKIGDGVTMFRDLPWIINYPNTVEYSIKIGSELKYYTYDSILNEFTRINNSLSDLLNDVNYLKSRSVYFMDKYDPEIVGLPNSIYVDKSNNDLYRYDTELGKYVQITNNFDRIVCRL